MDQKSTHVDIFISYAHRDKKQCEELKKHLSNMRRQQLINTWYDGEIMPGDKWETQILDHLNSAQIILLLISPDFMDSEFCNDIELAQAMERDKQGSARLIPILLRPVEWKRAIFSELQVLPTGALPITRWSNKDEAFSSVAEGIRKVIETSFPQKAESTSFPSANSERIPPPTHPASIVQREKIVKYIHEKLIQPETTALVLTGIDGIGKSTLAALVRDYLGKQPEQKLDALPTQTTWISVNPRDTIIQQSTKIFDELGIKQTIDYQNPTKQAAMLLRALDKMEQPQLIILDQFEDVLDMQTGLALPENTGLAQWLDVLNSQPCRSRLLLTSRSFPTGNEAHIRTHLKEYQVPTLGVEEVKEFLQKQKLEISENDVKLVFEHCGGHTFALTLLAKQLQVDRNLNLSALFKSEMHNEIRKEEIEAKLLDKIFTNLTKGQQELLFAFSIYREPIPLAAAQRILSTDTFSPQIAKNQLVAREVLLAQDLIREKGIGQYQPHTIVADYAKDHFDEQNRQNSICEAHANAALYYLEIAKINQPVDTQLEIKDLQSFVEAIWHLCQAKQWQQVYDLIEQEKLFAPLRRLGYNFMLADCYQQMLSQQQWQPSDLQLGRIYKNLGDVYRTFGKLDQAQKYLELALNLFEQEKAQRYITWQADNLGQDYNWTLNNLGRIYNIRNQFAQAQIYFEQALTICEETGNKGDEVTTLNELANTYRLQGQLEIARKYHEQALVLSQAIKDPGKEAASLKYLGDISTSLKKKPQAQKYYEQALHIQKGRGLPGQAGKTLHSLGVVYGMAKQQEKAIAAYLEALEILHEVGDSFEEGETLNDLAQTYETLGHTEEARKYFGEELSLYRELGDQERENVVLLHIGRLYLRQDNFEIALACFRQAQQVFEQIHSNHFNEAQSNIKTLQKKVGKKRFDFFLEKVEYQTAMIIEQALRE